MSAFCADLTAPSIFSTDQRFLQGNGWKVKAMKPGLQEATIQPGAISIDPQPEVSADRRAKLVGKQPQARGRK